VIAVTCVRGCLAQWRSLLEKELVMKAALFACGLGALTLPTAASAEPAWRADPYGSGIIIYASNSEDVAYNCSFSYSYSYTDFGTPRTGSNSGTFYVRARVGEFIAHQREGGFVNFTLTNGPNVRCTRA
jgi:hypothetical protein